MSSTSAFNIPDLKPKSQAADTTTRFNSNFTANVIAAIGPKTTPRIRQVTSSLIRHVHDFARENELTIEELMEGVELLNWAGKMSDEKRNEGLLVWDVIGVES